MTHRHRITLTGSLYRILLTQTDTQTVIQTGRLTDRQSLSVYRRNGERLKPDVLCWTGEILVLRSERRTLFGNKNRLGRSRRQTWFCGKFHRWASRPFAQVSSAPRRRSSSPGPCTSQTAGATSCEVQKRNQLRVVF